MARARLLDCMVENVRVEEEIGENAEPGVHARQAQDCAQEAIELAKHTENRRQLAEAVFNGKRELQQIDLYPITLGFHESRTKRGRPMPATGELATSIIDRVSKLSKAIGTNVVMQDGKGVVNVASRSASVIAGRR